MRTHVERRHPKLSIVIDTEANAYEEPSAIISHAGICAGTAGRPAVLPRLWNRGVSLKDD